MKRRQQIEPEPFIPDMGSVVLVLGEQGYYAAKVEMTLSEPAALVSRSDSNKPAWVPLRCVSAADVASQCQYWKALANALIQKQMAASTKP